MHLQTMLIYMVQKTDMKKLNYLIHMMEREIKDEKTQNVTEELVLYMFLGVFTIFHLVDSFARAGKYTR